MGQNNSKNYNEKQKKLKAQYNFSKTIVDPTLGEIKYMKHKDSNETVAWIDLTSQNLNIDEEFKKNFKKHSEISNEHVATLKQMIHTKEEFICGSQTKVEVVFEYYENNLLKDLATRQVSDSHYTEAELWNINDSVVSGCAILQENEISHQDICPENIMLTSEGHVKIGNYSIVFRGLTGYFKLYTQKTQFCYLSPKLIAFLRKAERKPVVNFYKADVFSLGMVLLQTATLKEINNCYNLEQGVINQKELNIRLEEVQEKYSKLFADYLRLLLIEDPEQRQDWISLYQRIEQNQQNRNQKEQQELQEQNYMEQQGFNEQQHQQQLQQMPYGMSQYPNYSQIPIQQQSYNYPYQLQPQQQSIHLQPVQQQLQNEQPNTYLTYQNHQLSTQPYLQQQSNYSYQPQIYHQQVQQEQQEQQEQLLQVGNTGDQEEEEEVEEEVIQNQMQYEEQLVNARKGQVEQQQLYKNEAEVEKQQQQQQFYAEPENQQQQQFYEEPHQVNQYQQQPNYSVQPLQHQYYQVQQPEQSESVTIPQSLIYQPQQEQNEMLNKLNYQISQYQQQYLNVDPNQLENEGGYNEGGEENIPTFNPQQQMGLETETVQTDIITEQYNDASIYVGQKVNGLRHGKGKFQYTDGGVYEGDWNQGAMDGLGYLYYPNGKLAYEGEWVNNAFSGQGVVYNEEPIPLDHTFDYTNFDYLQEHWEKYQGEFQDDYKEGFGTLYLVNGEKYVGQFNHDMIHGQGAFYSKHGGDEVIHGTWERNQLKQPQQ